jgi:pimeloyl-ACP methyl ester carboxylesterase
LEVCHSKKRRIWISLILLAGGAAAFVPLTHGLLAMRLMFAFRNLASGATGEDLRIIVDRVERQRGRNRYEALSYRRADSYPERAVMLTAGISELGCYHPRLMALCRSLANQGFLIVTPDIRMFRQFRMSPEAMEEIAFWFEQIHTLEAAKKVRQVGLAGISFSGTLALITAARPGIRDRVAYVLGIGAYDDPLRCSHEWFKPGPVTVSPGYFPTRFYAKWIIMLASLEMLPKKEERLFLQKVLEDLLQQRNPPPPPREITPAAERWYRLALLREDQSDPDLARQIEEHLVPILYRQITPDGLAEEVRCPVFLVHGAYDDLIPAEESRRLCRRLTHAPCHLLISPFLTHTHPLQKSLSWSDKANAAFRFFLFLYSFAEVVQ